MVEKKKKVLSGMQFINEGKEFHEDRFEELLEEMEINDWEEIDLSKCYNFHKMDLKPGYPIRYLGLDRNGDVFYRSGGFVSTIEEKYIIYQVMNLGSIAKLGFSLQYSNLVRFFVLRKVKSKGQAPPPPEKIKKVEEIIHTVPKGKKLIITISKPESKPKSEGGGAKQLKDGTVVFNKLKKIESIIESEIRGIVVAVHKNEYEKKRFESTKKFLAAKNEAVNFIVKV